MGFPIPMPTPQPTPTPVKIWATFKLNGFSNWNPCFCFCFCWRLHGGVPIREAGEHEEDSWSVDVNCEELGFKFRSVQWHGFVSNPRDWTGYGYLYLEELCDDNAAYKSLLGKAHIGPYKQSACFRGEFKGSIKSFRQISIVWFGSNS